MLQEVPDTVVIAYIGRSNGAGPVLSAHVGRAGHHRAGQRQGIPRRCLVVVAGAKRGAGDDGAGACQRGAGRLADAVRPQSARLCPRARRRSKAGRSTRFSYERCEKPIGTSRLHAARRDRAAQAAISTRARRAKIAELDARADVDPLLDILNRRGFERELKRSLAYVKRYGTEAALIYLDLDGFKAINDRTAMAPATRCSRRWRRGWSRKCAPQTWWRGSAATNSPC